MKITVIYGTETGNAELVADDIQEQLSEQFEVSCNDLATFDPAQFEDGDCAIVICSTYGDGELPNSAIPFFTRLQKDRPNLNNLKFAAFGLGDSFYETFNKGSSILAESLIELGAQEIGTRGFHDASSGEMPSEVALEWLQDIITELA